MAKMFYSLQEAAEKLGISPDEVREKIEAGELSEFRSGDELVVKREQVDMLAGDTGDGDADDGSIGLDELNTDEIGLSDSVLEDDSPIIDTGHDSLVIGLDDSGSDSIGLSDDDAVGGSFGLGDSASEPMLADSVGGSIGLDDELTTPMNVGSTSGGTPADSGIGLGGSSIGLGGSGVISLASEASGSGMEVESPKDQTGISIFDDGLDDVDASEATLVTDSPMFETDASASGSGLLDLTREGDDTSLGVDLLDDGYGGGDDDAGVAPAEAGALFETTAGGEVDLAQAAPMMVFQEAYDGSGSGLVGGLALGIVAAMLFLGAIVFMALMNQPGTRIIDQLGGTMSVGVGEVPIAVLAVAGVTVIAGIIGLVLGKKS
ncbi:MAG: helix-turn-helix domain-containing protein [Phycisphaerales bacterium]|nr:helix-turn-helix domain-containing protein [Phycisphaerales bacterium]MCB9835997.1 helix-turn-helix domain-containing protein [Phycisphaera sp.]